MAELIGIMDGVHYDELLGGTAVTPLTANVTLTAAAAGVIKRGTLLAESSGKYAAVAKGGTAVAVLAADVLTEAAGDVVATVYVRGIFNREKLVVADGDTADAHEDELRKIGIYMSGLQGVAQEADAGNSDSTADDQEQGNA